MVVDREFLLKIGQEMVQAEVYKMEIKLALKMAQQQACKLRTVQERKAVDQDVAHQYEEMFNKLWPKALEILKDLAEK
jgi:Tfp pilus assembly protein PilF